MTQLLSMATDSSKRAMGVFGFVTGLLAKGLAKAMGITLVEFKVPAVVAENLGAPQYMDLADAWMWASTLVVLWGFIHAVQKTRSASQQE